MTEIFGLQDRKVSGISINVGVWVTTVGITFDLEGDECNRVLELVESAEWERVTERKFPNEEFISEIDAPLTLKDIDQAVSLMEKNNDRH
jgi:hypothetical protein